MAELVEGVFLQGLFGVGGLYVEVSEDAGFFFDGFEFFGEGFDEFVGGLVVVFGCSEVVGECAECVVGVGEVLAGLLGFCAALSAQLGVELVALGHAFLDVEESFGFGEFGESHVFYEEGVELVEEVDDELGVVVAVSSDGGCEEADGAECGEEDEEEEADDDDGAELLEDLGGFGGLGGGGDGAGLDIGCGVLAIDVRCALVDVEHAGQCRHGRSDRAEEDGDDHDGTQGEPEDADGSGERDVSGAEVLSESAEGGEHEEGEGSCGVDADVEVAAQDEEFAALAEYGEPECKYEEGECGEVEDGDAGVAFGESFCGGYVGFGCGLFFGTFEVMGVYRVDGCGGFEQVSFGSNGWGDVLFGDIGVGLDGFLDLFQGAGEDADVAGGLVFVEAAFVHECVGDPPEKTDDDEVCDDGPEKTGDHAIDHGA